MYDDVEPYVEPVVDDLEALGRVIDVPVRDDEPAEPPLPLKVTVYPLDAKLAVIVLLAVTVPDALLQELKLYLELAVAVMVLEPMVRVLPLVDMDVPEGTETDVSLTEPPVPALIVTV